MGCAEFVGQRYWPGTFRFERASPLEATIREHLRRRRLRARKWAFAGGAALLLGSIFLILQTRDPAPIPQTIQIVLPGTELSTPITRTPTPEPSLPVSVWYQPSFFIPVLFIAALFAAGIILIAGHSILARVTGASLLFAATMSSQFHLIKEFKFSPELTLGSRPLTTDQVRDVVDTRIAEMKIGLVRELKMEIESLIQKIDINGIVDSRIAVMKVGLFNELKAELKSLVDKIEVNIDKVALEAKFNTYLRQIGALGPEHLGDFVGFEPGRSEFTANMKTSVADVCNRWLQRTDYQEGLLLVVGATDRIPLGPTARLRYESNFGLARARAEEIKSKIVECGVPALQILAIVSGPRTTPERKNPSIADAGYPQDRMVDVWAIWSWRDRR
jgi:outer membrane protein OmpA-like peptidoglycan-associated protein